MQLDEAFAVNANSLTFRHEMAALTLYTQIILTWKQQEGTRLTKYGVVIVLILDISRNALMIFTSTCNFSNSVLHVQLASLPVAYKKITNTNNG